MIAKIILILFTIVPVLTFSQSLEEDEVRFKAAKEWLDSKLNYVYYDGAGGKWWNNTFYINDDKEITIKHIASNKVNTADIRSKTYTVRTFKIQDINPNSLKINRVEKSKGRLVKGQMLELRTYGFQELIHKSINNRKASSTSFLFLSFPELLIDSLSNYAEIVKEKFETAILASTQIYSTGSEEDITSILNILSGTFQSNDGDVWKAEKAQTNVFKLERQNGKIEYFGFDPDKSNFYLLSISSEGTKRQDFILEKNGRLSLVNSEGAVAFLIDTNNSFVLNDTKYFRQ